MFNLQKGFPENFKWGSSTNAQQFEGGYKEGGKGLSIADVRVIPDMPDESDFESFKTASTIIIIIKRILLITGNGLPNLSFYNGLVENFPERRRNRTKRCWS